VFWPLASFIHALRNFQLPGSRVLVVLFYAAFGYFFVIPSAEVDSYRHYEKFLKVAEEPMSTFFNSFAQRFSENEDFDFAFDLFNYLVSRITTDRSMYFCLMSLVFGLLLVKLLEILHKEYQFSTQRTVLLLFFFTVVLLLPSRILSIRHYTATLVFFIGLNGWLSRRSIKGLILIGCTPLIHFGFLFALIVFATTQLLGTRFIFYYLLIALSFVVQAETANTLRGFGDFVEGTNEQRIKGYTNEDYIADVNESRGQQVAIVTSYSEITRYYLLAALLIVQLQLRRADKVTQRFMAMALCFFAFVNVVQDMYSILGRFSVVFSIASALALARVYSRYTIRKNLFFYSMLLIVGINAVVLIRITLEYTGVSLIVPFLPLTVLLPVDYSLLDLIKKGVSGS